MIPPQLKLFTVGATNQDLLLFVTLTNKALKGFGPFGTRKQPVTSALYSALKLAD